MVIEVSGEIIVQPHTDWSMFSSDSFWSCEQPTSNSDRKTAAWQQPAEDGKFDVAASKNGAVFGSQRASAQCSDGHSTYRDILCRSQIYYNDHLLYFISGINTSEGQFRLADLRKKSERPDCDVWTVVILDVENRAVRQEVKRRRRPKNRYILSLPESHHVGPLANRQ